MKILEELINEPSEEGEEAGLIMNWGKIKFLGKSKKQEGIAF